MIAAVQIQIQSKCRGKYRYKKVLYKRKGKERKYPAMYEQEAVELPRTNLQSYREHIFARLSGKHKLKYRNGKYEEQKPKLIFLIKDTCSKRVAGQLLTVTRRVTHSHAHIQSRVKCRIMTGS